MPTLPLDSYTPCNLTRSPLDADGKRLDRLSSLRTHFWCWIPSGQAELQIEHLTLVPAPSPASLRRHLLVEIWSSILLNNNSHPICEPHPSLASFEILSQPMHYIRPQELFSFVFSFFFFFKDDTTDLREIHSRSTNSTIFFTRT